ncbi:MAG TPA: hypothetical protein VIY71_03130 [Solirubrobacterales bacterium]
MAVVATAAALLFMGVGCGSGNTAETQESVEARQSREAQRRVQRQVAIHRAHARVRHEVAQRRARRARHEREQQARERRARAAEEQAEAEAEVGEEESSCDPNYSGACLDPSAYDYDCEGGSGDGPYYTGTVTVTGEDHYGLDADSDGTGCESY